MNPCLKCGQAPSLRTIDVTSLSVAHYLHCNCGANTSWHYKPEACTAEWNKANPAQSVEPVQTVQTVQAKPIPKPIKQPSKATSALLRMKAVYGNA